MNNKTMRKYKFSLCLVVLMGLLCSCNDDFLERAPIVNMSDASYWKTVNDLKLYVNNFYSRKDLLKPY